VAQGVIICVGSFGPGPDWVRGKSMLTCPNCHAGVPEEMRFCLQCGASVAPTPPPAASPVAADPPMPAAIAPVSARPEPPHKGTSTVPLKIAPTPVVAPRDGAPTGHERPGLGDQTEEVDDESLKKSFLRPVTQVGAVICRFCKGPLDLDGDFCEQCGAPVAEAAPPGMIKPKPQSARPAIPAPAAARPPVRPAQAAPPARPAAASTPTRSTSNPPAPAARPAAPAARPTPTPPRTPAPVAPPPAPAPPSEDEKSGLMGRFKGLFKKS